MTEHFGGSMGIRKHRTSGVSGPPPDAKQAAARAENRRLDNIQEVRERQRNRMYASLCELFSLNRGER